MSFEEVRKALTSLSKEELQQLIRQANFLLGDYKADTKLVSGTVKILFQYLKQHCWIPTTFNDKTELRLANLSVELENLVEQLKLNKPKTYKLCRILVEIAVSDLREQNKALSFQSIINLKLSDPKSLLNNAFPGYDGNLIKRFVLN
jgi:hypothetical protein